MTAERAEELYHEAAAFHDAAEWEKALALYDRALVIRPDFARAHCARALVLWNLHCQEEALAAVTSAISAAPRFAEAYFNRANMLRQRRQFAGALEDYNRAIAIRPDFAPALNNRAGLHQSLKRYDEALKDLDHLVRVTPASAAAHYNRGALLLQEEKFDQAWDSLSQALALSPDHADAFGALATAAIGACDFERVEMIKPRLRDEILAGRIVMPPVILCGQEDDPALQRKCGEVNLRAWLADDLGAAAVPLDLTHYGDRPLRIAYMSSNFGNHPVGRQIVGVLEKHDRSRHEVIGLSLGGNDGSGLRHRITGACDQFLDLSDKSDADAAAMVRQLKVHVLVDLNCQTEGWRPGICMRRAAPVQISFLGYAGTTGADFVDYVIADERTVPVVAEPFYSERIARLPDSFWPSDAKRRVAETSRLGNGLPEEALVFCAFNNHHKISRSMFACWMRLLQASPGSVLWLRSAPETVARNLLRQAAASNVDPSRIIFAPVVSDEVHLGRHRLADLFLDTAPYNAHSSASDALWMGLPVLTLKGLSFAGRVASSMLYALDLPELVTDSLQSYEATALALAGDRCRLESLKIKLASRLKTAPLFDGERFRANLEAAYRAMWANAREGKPPRSFSAVPDHHIG
jgi:predicted O-linked N-acetylglucosamine transferase (SPINDLY family)